MKRSQKILADMLIMALLAGALSACGTPNHSSSAVSSAASSAAEADSSQTDSGVQIQLNGDRASVTGSGAQYEDGTLTISAGGVYRISGTLSDGRILVNAPNEDVTLVLNNAEITNTSGIPVYIYQAGQAVIQLADGSVNTLTDGSSYTFADAFSSAEESEPNACVYAKSDLTISGSGALTVNANYKNGITGKDTLTIDSATITVNAVNHGINGKDQLIINRAALTVVSGGDALRSTNDIDESLGCIAITDAMLNLTAGEDGIQAETNLTISGGSCTVQTGGGNTVAPSADTSAKGFKAGKRVELCSGTFALDCSDDAIHSNGDVLILGGDWTIATGDDGVHADETVEITGGVIVISESYEGIEGTTVNISDGDIRITSSDDGINAAGGADQSGFGGMRPDPFTGSSECAMIISGGTVCICASGDGLDSNGDLTVSGGEIYVVSTGSGDSAIDYDGSAKITGGVVIAAGANGMAQNFGSDSTQGSILLNLGAYSNAAVTLTDADGHVLAEYSPTQQYNSVVISTPELTVGNTYTVQAGGQTTSVTLDSLIYGSGMSGGFPGGGPNGKPGQQPGGGFGHDGTALPGDNVNRTQI